MTRLLSLSAILFLALTLSVRAETFLLMAEEKGCMWCARWNSEIAHIYPKTPEGQTAPLRRFDVHQGDPEDVTFQRPVRFTPTFVLVKDGMETGRIEGYPGEDFFWGLLGQLFERARIDINASG
jgi:thioredoxin-related protein